MTPLPDKLIRKAIKRHFTRLSEARWEHLFEHEKKNGIFDCRCDGPYKDVVYYSTTMIKAWLITHAYYDAPDFDQARSITPTRWSGLAAVS